MKTPYQLPAGKLMPLKLKLPPLMHVSLVFHVFAGWRVGPLDGGEVKPTIPVAIEVERASAYRVRLFNWEVYGPEERCWIPAREALSQSSPEAARLAASLALGCPPQRLGSLTVNPARRHSYWSVAHFGHAWWTVTVCSLPPSSPLCLPFVPIDMKSTAVHSVATSQNYLPLQNAPKSTQSDSELRPNANLNP